MLAERIIRKHVCIIHAYSLMSVLQRKIVNVLLYEAVKNGNHGSNESVVVECRIPFSSLYKAVKFNSHNTRYLKEAIDGLASLKIEWNLLKDKVPSNFSFLNLRILHGSPTFYQDNTLNFSFHKIMMDFVESPVIYGTVDIDIQSEFESKYSHALYENSTRFVNLQKNKIIPIETFRKLLGIQHDKYLDMREITRSIISPSIEEVNDRANVNVKLDPVKRGRNITGFEVSVNDKKNKKTGETVSSSHYNNETVNQITQIFGPLKESILKDIFDRYSSEYIMEKIKYTMKFANRLRNNYYPVPYFISALKHDYKLSEDLKINDAMMTENTKSEWSKKLSELQDDLTHWEKLYSYRADTMDNKNSEVIKNIISTCKEKIKQHYIEKPEKEEEVS